MSPEQLKAEIEFIAHDPNELYKMIEEEGKKYANMSPEQLKAEIEFIKQSDEEEELKKTIEEVTNDYYKNKKSNE